MDCSMSGQWILFVNNGCFISAFKLILKFFRINISPLDRIFAIVFTSFTRLGNPFLFIVYTALFFVFLIYCSIVDLLCVNFCCTAKWGSYTDTHTHTYSLVILFSIMIYHRILSIFLCVLQRASWVAQMVKNLPAMWETWVWSWGQEDPLEKGNPLRYSCLENSMGRGAWQAIVHGIQKSRTRLST